MENIIRKGINDMKKIVIACGAGLATSSMVRSRVEEMLEDNKVRAEIEQTTLAGLGGYDENADLFITTMKVKESKYSTPVVLGSSYLTGINVDSTNEEILKILKGD